MLTVNDLSLRYKQQTGKAAGPRRNAVPDAAVDGVSFTVDEGEFFTLLGPSGCGKSTTLRCIAGLETPDDGEILLKEHALYSRRKGINIPAHARGLGMVFQSYAIWPHMTVLENVRFPLLATRKRTRMSKAEITERCERALETVGLLDLVQRPATRLSGGQQQRLALARALASTPPLLLLDEPLSNLDANLREAMRIELKRLQQSLGLTVIYVTHDQVEALSLSTGVAVMNRGSVVQIGPPRAIYDTPASEYVAKFVGTSSILTGLLVETRNGCQVVKCDFGTVEVAGTSTKKQPGDEVRIYVRPEDVLLSDLASRVAADPPAFCGTVVTTSYMGDRMTHVLDVAGARLLCTSNVDFYVQPGDTIGLSFAPGGLRLLAS